VATGDLLTRGTIWLALGSSVLGAAGDRLGRRSAPWQSAARLAWTAGCAAYLGHVISAFNFYHGWSHTAAYRETARRTAEIFGVNWGGGLFVNYLFTAAWVAGVIWRWKPESYQRRPRFFEALWRSLFLMMVFSASVVFETGLARWVGIIFSSTFAFLWWSPSCEKSSRVTSGPKRRG
jgi:hypothetical protein